MDPSPEPELDHLALRASKDIAYGSVAGMLSKVFEHPFDLTKVRLQAQVLDRTARFSGPVDCLAQTWQAGGVKGLYRGLSAPVAGAMAENATLFLSYSELQSLIRRVLALPPAQELTLPQLAVAAAGAGAITSFVLTPIELVKCKMQVQMIAPGASPAPAFATAATTTARLSGGLLASSSATPITARPKLPGPISIIASVLRTEGVRGMWLGHSGTLLRETGGGVAWFTTKEFVASCLLARDPSPHSLTTTAARPLHAWESALSGACAGVAYNVALFPADTIKSAMQTEEELRPRAAGVPRLSFLGMGRALWTKQGLRGLYAGCGITVARAVPSSALIFLVYDGLKTRFG